MGPAGTAVTSVLLLLLSLSQCDCGAVATGAVGSLTETARVLIAELRNEPCSPSPFSSNPITSDPAVINSTRFVTSGTSLPIGSFRASTVPESERRFAVRMAVLRAWDAYERDAWGYDELKPVSRTGVNTFTDGSGVTIVDSLATLYLLDGADGRYRRARDWVATELDFSRVGRVIVFETVIRMLGGLVSMYHLSGDAMYLEKSEDLGARLAAAFDTPLGLPWPRCYLNETGRCEHHPGAGDTLYLAEVGTVQLEFRALAHHSRQPLLQEMRGITERIIDTLQVAGSDSQRLSGVAGNMLPFAISMNSGRFATNMATLGAPADSYFEYLVKMWVQGGKREGKYWELFAGTMDAIVEFVLYKSRYGDVIVRDLYARVGAKMEKNESNVQYMHKMDHFCCAVIGMIILGLDGLGQSDRDVARRIAWEGAAADLTETCWKMYSRSPSGLAGEHIKLGVTDQWKSSGGYELRPEAMEAFFFMYRHTKDEKYRDWGWEVFQAIETHCRTDGGGYATIRNPRARVGKLKQEDVMHSFLIAETFRYAFLLFGDDDNELPLDKWVFNTEAHPLLIMPGLGDVNSFLQDGKGGDARQCTA
jgi:Glycosyl hydrolase family 47